MYKLHKSTITNEVVSVNKYENGVQVLSIPFAPDNTDYQTYLKWVSEGNTPEPAEE